MNIRSLLIENVDLGDISVLGTLQSLETLELPYCEIDEFSPEIAMLKKLRLLSLTYCEIISNNPFEVIQRCPSLEELYFCDSFNDFCQEITLPTLERYILTDYSSHWNWSLSKVVVLEGDRLSEATYKYVMKTSYYLDLIRIQGWINLMPEIVPIDEGMNDLIELRLGEISQLQCLVDTKHINSQVLIVFSKLVVLELKRMEALEELCNGPIPFDFMNNLKIVKLERCPRLVSVFEQSTSQSLLLLEKLEIIDCEKLENIITFEESVDGYNDNKSCYSLFPKLKFLKIEKCHQLQFILPILSTQDLLFLEDIRIRCCQKLEYIFDQHQDVKLTSLKVVMIDDLPNFIDIFAPKASSISKDGSKPQTQLDPIKRNIFSNCCYGYKFSTKFPLVSKDQPQDCSISLDSNSYCQCLPKFFGNVFPKLKRLHVRNCMQLEYIFGNYNHDHQLECPQLASGDFITTRSLNGTIIKELSGNEENEQQMNLSLEDIELIDLPMMTCLFVGLKYSFVLNNLTWMRIVRCEKLEIVFSTSVLRCLPQLVSLHVIECKELKHIIEDDLEDKNFQSSNTFFPKLETLVVTKCDKLKYVFPVSICKEFPELKVMLIREANELEEIFKSDKKDEIEEISKTEVDIPNLKAVAFAYLPRLCHDQGVHFQTVNYRFVHSCQKLSLTSCNDDEDEDDDLWEDYDLRCRFEEIKRECDKAASEHKLTSPQMKTKQTAKGEHDEEAENDDEVFSELARDFKEHLTKEVEV